MRPRKLSAHFIFDGKDQFIKNGVLNLDENGTVRELRKPLSEGREEAGVEFYSGIITPGFINAHCHIELSHLKGLAPKGKGMTPFLETVIKHRGSEKEIVEKAMLKADLSMQKEGIVAVGDVCNSDVSFDLKSTSPIYYYNFLEVLGIEKAKAEKIFKEACLLQIRAKKVYGLDACIVPHSAYTVSERLFELLREHLNKRENIISVHNQESEEEEEYIRNHQGLFYDLFKKMGMDTGDLTPKKISPLEYLQRSLPEKPKRLYIHNVETSEDDIHLAHPDFSNTYWVLCPLSNLHISGKLPSGFFLERYPQNVCIGTDSLASNDQLSIIKELFTLQEHFREISLEKLLRFACFNGALSLGIESRFGAFEPGMRPGINLIHHADLKNLKLSGETGVRVLR